MDHVVQIFIFDVLILQFRINNVNVVCAFCSPSWFLHGFHLFYLHDLLHSHKVFSYVCVILRHGGSWARKLRRQFFNKRSSCHKNPVIIKKPPCSRFQKHDGIVSSLQFLIMSDKLNFIVVSFIHHLFFSVKNSRCKLLSFYLPTDLQVFVSETGPAVSGIRASFLIYGITIAAATISDVTSATGVAQATPRIPIKWLNKIINGTSTVPLRSMERMIGCLFFPVA